MKKRSVKIYRLADSEKYLVIKSRYFWGFRIFREHKIVDSFEAAQDLINNMKFDNYIEKVENYWH